jgi:hypothetical protein
VTKIDKEVRGIKLCEYKVCTTFTGCAPRAQGCAPCAHNTIEENIDINKERENKATSKFQKPSLEEVREYCLSRNSPVDPEEFFSFYESNGWKVGKNPMKNWHSAIVTWEKKREKEVAPRKRESNGYKKESVFEHNLRVMDRMYGTNLHEQAYGKTDK